MAGGTSSAERAPDTEVVEQSSFVDINVTPLVDIFLVLLVILMATSTAILEAGQGAGGKILVNMPSGSESDDAVGNTDNTLVIAIPSDGAIIVRGEQVSMSELQDLLQTEAARSEDQLVLVQADGDARHKNVVEVMEAARKAGLTNLAIATRAE